MPCEAMAKPQDSGVQHVHFVVLPSDLAQSSCLKHEAAPFHFTTFSVSFRRLICLVLLCAPLLAEEFRATVVAVFDGDTIRVLDAQKVQHKIRLDAIDAPESKQPYGTQAKKYLSSLVFGKNVRIVYKEKDRYDRILGTVFVDGKNINLMVVEAGYAWHYVYFAKNKLEYAEAEARAKKARRGLWAGTETPVPPWDYRKAKKSKQNKEGQGNDVSN